MIKANELRIGNTIMRDGIVTDMKLPYFSNLYRLEPIPITEEFLVKYFHYEKNFTILENNCFTIYANFEYKNEIQIWAETAFSEQPLEIKYVHQLQNLFFALTQTEIEPQE